jgi:hypothetical protein
MSKQILRWHWADMTAVGGHGFTVYPKKFMPLYQHVFRCVWNGLESRWV